MIDHSRQFDGGYRPARLALPVQAPPVDRTGARAAGGGEAGVEADGWLDVVGDIAKVGLPILGGALGI